MRRSHGFTLIELLVTVAILSLLSLGALPIAELTVKRGKEQELRSALRQIRSAIDDYKKATEDGRVAKAVDETGYPPSLDALAAGVVNLKDASKRKIYFLRRVPRDPLVGDASIGASDTWGLRSYASPPEAPLAGKDVFDVYSRAAGDGINGVPYREW